MVSLLYRVFIVNLCLFERLAEEVAEHLEDRCY